MPTPSAKTSPVSILTAVARYFGICLFLVSFSLPAVGNLTGLDCAEFAMKYWPHDDKISSLALFGGWLNPQVLLLFFLSVFRVFSPLRAMLTVTILFSIPMTWIAIHRMNAAGMYMDPQGRALSLDCRDSFYHPPKSAAAIRFPFHLRDDSLCQKLPPASNSQQTQQGDFLEGCMKHLTFLRSPSARLWGRYGPEHFPTWPQFQEAMQELGYPAATDWLSLPRPTPQEYENYLWELAWPEHQLAHDGFVRRILAAR